jgi:hypothetical protein
MTGNRRRCSIDPIEKGLIAENIRRQRADPQPQRVVDEEKEREKERKKEREKEREREREKEREKEREREGKRGREREGERERESCGLIFLPTRAPAKSF